MNFLFFLQLSGHPGSGKSTLAKQIIQHVDAVIVDHDVTKSALLKSLSHSTFEDGEIGKIAYEMDWTLVEYYLSLGKSVILDSPCLYDDMLTLGIFLSIHYQANYRYIECVIHDVDELNQRLQSRQRKMSQIKSVTTENFHRTLSNCKRPTGHEILKIDTTKSTEDHMEAVLHYLKNP